MSNLISFANSEATVDLVADAFNDVCFGKEPDGIINICLNLPTICKANKDRLYSLQGLKRSQKERIEFWNYNALLHFKLFFTNASTWSR